MPRQRTMIKPMGDWSDLALGLLAEIGIGDSAEDRANAEFKRQQQAYAQQQAAAVALAEAQAQAAEEQAALEARRAASESQALTGQIEIVAIGAVVVLAVVGTWIMMRKKK